MRSEVTPARYHIAHYERQMFCRGKHSSLYLSAAAQGFVGVVGVGDVYERVGGLVCQIFAFMSAHLSVHVCVCAA